MPAQSYPAGDGGMNMQVLPAAGEAYSLSDRMPLSSAIES
jgi:hypothetical protein